MAAGYQDAELRTPRPTVGFISSPLLYSLEALAFVMMSCFRSFLFPKTLQYPRGTASMMGAAPVLF